ncbi:MAG: MFS transporter [Solirubrobacteraceae bacterium]
MNFVPTPSQPTPTPLRILLSGEFGWFFAGRTVDLLGSSMTTVALALSVLQASGNASDLGIVLAANMIPTLILLLLGGVVADRISRGVLLICSNLSSAVSIGAMGGLLIGGRYSLVAFTLLSFVNGAVGAFTSPALRGIVPELVENHDLQRANALLASTQNAVRIIGPTAAGLIVSTAGGGWALLADAVSYLMAALAFTRIRTETDMTASKQRLWRDLVDGWSVFTSMRWVVIMTISFALINAFNVGPWNVLGPQVVSQESGAFGWGAVLTVRAAGLLVMSVVALKLTLRYPLRDGRLWGTIAALPLLALGLSGQAWVVASAAFVGGLGFTLAAITWESTLQQSVPNKALSRVAAYDDLFSYLAIPVSQLAVGPLSGTFGAPRVALTCGIAYIAASLLPLVNRQVRTMTRG